MKINEIFYSLQGEGKLAGLPSIFIRTTGCNLRCTFCDTTYAYENGEEKTIGEIVDEIQRFSCKYVCITGGEPLLQDETTDLINTLIRKDYKICLETNGSISIEKIAGKQSLLVSLDIKTPSSNMHKKMNFNNIIFLTNNDQLKFIIKNIGDYNFAKKILVEYEPKCDVFFQPTWDSNPKDLSSWILKDGLEVRLGLQLHKIIWGDKRGV